MNYRAIAFSLSPLCLIWFGIVVGISVIEAPAKFSAPSLTREVALDVGRSVFGVLNKVELVLLGLVLVLACLRKRSIATWLGLGAVATILALQTLWLLPELIVRTELILSGVEPEASYAHGLYAVLELSKLLLLLALGLGGLATLSKGGAYPDLR